MKQMRSPWRWLWMLIYWTLDLWSLSLSRVEQLGKREREHLKLWKVLRIWIKDLPWDPAFLDNCRWLLLKIFAFLDDCRPVFVQDLPQSLHWEGCRGMWRRTGSSAILNDNKTRVRAQIRRVDCRSFDETLCANASLRSLPNVMTHARFQIRRNWPKHSRNNFEETRC